MEKHLTETTIRTEQLLADLKEMWASLAQQKNNGAVLLKACSMTLLVTSGDETDAARVRRVVGVVMRQHPARAIVIRITPGAATEAHVFAECRKGCSGNEQICSEGIEVVTDEANLSTVAREIAPLVVRDLPVMLWCRGSRVFGSQVFEPLFPLAQRIIVDSCSVPNAAAALAALKGLHSRGHRVADLAWTRTTGWREAIAARFDASPGEAGQIRSFSIRFSGDPAKSCAGYLKQWIKRAAPDARVALEPIPGETGIHQITVSVAGREMTIGEADARSSDATEAELIDEELSITDTDPVFEDLLNRA